MMQVKKKKLRHHSLTGRITWKVMHKAYKNVKRNRGAAGIDKVSIGIANYFIQDFTTSIQLFNRLDQWVRKRLRCMKYKRISRKDNPRIKIKHIRKMGLFFFKDMYQNRIKTGKLLPIPLKSFRR